MYLRVRLSHLLKRGLVPTASDSIFLSPRAESGALETPSICARASLTLIAKRGFVDNVFGWVFSLIERFVEISTKVADRY